MSESTTFHPRNHTTAWSFFVDSRSLWACVDNALTDEECEKIIEIGKSYKLEPAQIDDGQVDKEIRKNDVSWLYPIDIPEIYDKLSKSVLTLNANYFGMDLIGFNEGLQFTEYKSSNEFYDWHTDDHRNKAPRKLTVVVQLSDPDTYKGGDLELAFGNQTSENVIKTKKERGSLIAFPSYTLHRVSPVTEGTRYSLVGWITGPPLR